MHQFAQITPRYDPHERLPILFPTKIQYSTMLVKFLHENRKILLLNNALLKCVSADVPVVISEVCALHLPQEILIVSNDDELKV
jgi:hypothetical protein